MCNVLSIMLSELSVMLMLVSYGGIRLNVVNGIVIRL